MRQRVRLFPTLTLALLAAACSDATNQQPTAPYGPPSLAIVGDACSNTLRQRASDDIDAIYTGAQRTAARSYLTKVAQACSATDSTAARPAMFDLINYTIAQSLPFPSTATASDTKLVKLADLWNTLVRYIGATSTNISSAALTSAGAVKVISDPASYVNGATQIDIVTGDGQALLRVPLGAATGQTILYTIAPIACGSLNSSLPTQTGKCYDITDTPNYDAQFSKALTVAICQIPTATSPEQIKANAISHRVEGQGTPEVLPLVYVTAAGFCFNDPTQPSNNVLVEALKSAAQFVSSIFRARPAFALHGNLGGSTSGGLSPFGPVDRDIFRATFTANPTNFLTQPKDTTYGSDVGSWSQVYAQAPGSITLVSALDALTDRPVVLNQAGGNCDKSCGGLVLEAKAITTYNGNPIAEDQGKYVVTWKLLQDKPSVKAAPFLLLAERRTEGSTIVQDTIATIAYVTRPDGRYIYVNGSAVPGLIWVPGKAQTFRFEIDLAPTSGDATCRLNVAPTVGFDPARVDDIPCLWSQKAKGEKLRFIRADFTGIDAGIFAWDDIRMSLFTTFPYGGN